MKLVQYKSNDGSDLALFEFPDEISYDGIGECFVKAEAHAKWVEDSRKIIYRGDKEEEVNPLDTIIEYLKTVYGVYRTYIEETIYTTYL